MMIKVNREKGIIARVMERLQITDQGKVGYIYGRLKTSFERDIVKLEANLRTLKINHDTEILKIKDSVEEAEMNLVDVWESVTPDTASEIKPTGFEAFKDDFMRKLASCEHTLDSAESKMEKANESYKEQKTAIGDQIKTLKSHIETIEGNGEEAAKASETK